MRLTSEERRPRSGPPTPSPEPPRRLPAEPGGTKRELLETLVNSAAGTQEDLAEALGISYATLHAWKTGRRDVPDGALEDMARLALQRSRMLLEAGSRLLSLADADGSEPPWESMRLVAAETRARARTMRAQAKEATERSRERLKLRSQPSG